VKLTYRAGVVAGLLVGAVALAACSSSKTNSGSNNSSSTTPPTSTSTSTSAANATTCFSGTLNAEGSTAQANAMSAWQKGYQTACPGSTVNYNPTGSGAGVSEFNAGKVDFAGSDAALNPKATPSEVTAAQKRCGSTPLDLPMVGGPIAIAFKLNGVSKLVLNGTTIANIFLGKIKTWDDPAIKALNSGATLPSTKISVFYRSDSSGTTKNFESYLAATAPTVFASAPDKDSSKAGFAGQGKSGSQAVADGVSSTQGGIGYMEYSFAVNGSLSTASIDNGGGAVDISPDSASAAIASAPTTGTGNDLTLKLDYGTKTPGAYPITLVTYEIVCTKYADSAVATKVKDFLTYTVTSGQAGLKAIGYAPLPAALQAKVAAAVATIS